MLNTKWTVTIRMKNMKLSIKKRLFILTIIAVVSISWNKPLPKLFLIGDSISIQYGPFLEKNLENVVIFDRKQDDGRAEKNLDVPVGANGGDSRMVLAYLRTKMNDPDFKPDYLLLNCGLHDIKREPMSGKIQVPENQYKENLNAIVKLLEKKHIQLIWISTTPVVDTIHNAKPMSFHRFASDLHNYNKIADEVFKRNKIPVIDLYDFSRKQGVDQFIDHVHYNEQTRSLQAAYIAGFINCLIKNEKSK